MKNRFLDSALSTATRLAGKKGRMLQLVAQMTSKFYRSDKRNMRDELKGSLLASGRLISSYAKGHYRQVSVATFLKVLAGVIYFVNPLDLIPDALVGIGFLDDLAVLTWVHRSASAELEKFKSWELSFGA